MKTTAAHCPPTIPPCGPVLVLGRDVLARRRIEFLIRMAGCDPLGVDDVQEAINWLRKIATEPPAALVLMPSVGEAGCETLHADVALLKVPVVHVLLNGSSVVPHSVSRCGTATISEAQLIETLRALLMNTLPGSGRDAMTNQETAK